MSQGAIQSGPDCPGPSAQALAMDRMYRYTRHVYDLSRRPYLLGRDALLRQIPVTPGCSVLEIGCGTARNLVRLARLHAHRSPPPRLFGLDASHQMLATAHANLRRAGLQPHITLRQGLAERLSPDTFPMSQAPGPGFDHAFFSYCLSMVPPWREAIDAAVANLSPRGTLHVVDFHDQADLPRWFGKTLTAWLDLFHVHHRPELLPYLHQVARRLNAKLLVRTVHRRYAFLATLRLS